MPQALKCSKCGKDACFITPPTSGQMFGIKKMLGGLGIDVGTLGLDPADMVGVLALTCTTCAS